MMKTPASTFNIRNRFISAPLMLAACMLLYLFSQSAFTESRESGVTKAVENILASGRLPLLQQADFSSQAREVAKLYRMNPSQLIWLGEGRSEKNLNDALDVLSNSNADGLNPANYDAEGLRRYFQQAASLRQTEIQALASYDMALSVSMLRFLHDTYAGRIDPRGFNYPPQFGAKPAIDYAAMLKQHIDRQIVTELPSTAAPRNKQYLQLKQALADFRQQAAAATPAKLLFPKSMHPGDSDPQLPLLRRRLQELGELTAEQSVRTGDTETLYDPATIEAVMRLQQQQGLQADGLIGKQTLALLNQTPAEKIALIELAMERLRWLPDQPEGPMIMVNIPAFQLWAFHSADDTDVLNMKVVVGKAVENQTPILLEEMKYLEFMPYWNIPKSIMDKEILPKIQNSENYLASQDIELVERYANDDSEDMENIFDDIKHGRIRARQLPGKKNPLGKIKFIFPNKADVYLHDTPARGAFNRDRRDLSHGCVRVAEAEKLAEFVLNNQEGWDRQAIEQAMSGPKTRRVSLKKAIPVLFFYTTVYAGQDNKLRFYPDIYGYDAALHGALNKSENKLLISKNTAVDG